MLPRRAQELVKRFVGVSERVHYYLEPSESGSWISILCQPTHDDIKTALLGSSDVYSHPSLVRLLFQDDTFKDLRDRYVHLVDMLEFHCPRLILSELFNNLDKLSPEDRGRSFLLLASEVPDSDDGGQMVDERRLDYLDRIAESFTVSPPTLRTQLLLAASIIGHDSMVTLLLRDIAADHELSPSIDAVEAECLVEAAINQHFRTVELLLEGGRFLNGNETRFDGVVKALEVSCTNGSIDIADILLPQYLSHCTASSVCGSLHPRLLRLALSHRHFDVIELLLQCDPRGSLCNLNKLVDILRGEVDQAEQGESAQTLNFMSVVAGFENDDIGDLEMWDAAALARGILSENATLVRFLVNHVRFCREAMAVAMETAQDSGNRELVDIISTKLADAQQDEAVMSTAVEVQSDPTHSLMTRPNTERRAPSNVKTQRSASFTAVEQILSSGAPARTKLVTTLSLEKLKMLRQSSTSAVDALAPEETLSRNEGVHGVQGEDENKAHNDEQYLVQIEDDSSWRTVHQVSTAAVDEIISEGRRIVSETAVPDIQAEEIEPPKTEITPSQKELAMLQQVSTSAVENILCDAVQRTMKSNDKVVVDSSDDNCTCPVAQDSDQQSADEDQVVVLNQAEEEDEKDPVNEDMMKNVCQQDNGHLTSSGPITILTSTCSVPVQDESPPVVTRTKSVGTSIPNTPTSQSASPTRSTIVCPVKWVEQNPVARKSSVIVVEELPPLHDGDRVEVQYKGLSVLVPGVITFCRSNGSYDVAYEDGEEDMCIAREFIRPVEIALGGSTQSLTCSSGNVLDLENEGGAASPPVVLETFDSELRIGGRSSRSSAAALEDVECELDGVELINRTGQDDEKGESETENFSNQVDDELPVLEIEYNDDDNQPHKHSKQSLDLPTATNPTAEVQTPPKSHVDEALVENVVEVERLREIPSIIVPSTGLKEPIAHYSNEKGVGEIRMSSRASREKNTSHQSRCRTADYISCEEIAEWKNLDLLLSRKRRLFQVQTGSIESSKVPWGEEFATIQSLKRFATKHPDVLRAHIEAQLRELDGPLAGSSPGKPNSPRSRSSSSYAGAGQARDSLLLIKDLAFLLKTRLSPFFDAIIPAVMPLVFNADKRFLCETAAEVLDAIILHCSGRKLALVFLQLGESYSQFEDLRLYNLAAVYVDKCVRNWTSTDVSALQASQSSALLLSLLADALRSKSAPVRISTQKTLRHFRDELGARSFEAVLKAHVPPDVEALLLRECSAASAAPTKPASRRSSRRSQSREANKSEANVQTPTIVRSSPSILQRMLLQRQNRVIPATASRSPDSVRRGI